MGAAFALGAAAVTLCSSEREGEPAGNPGLRALLDSGSFLRFLCLGACGCARKRTALSSLFCLALVF